jgi:hypothetical protein
LCALSVTVSNEVGNKKLVAGIERSPGPCIARAIGRSFCAGGILFLGVDE